MTKNPVVILLFLSLVGCYKQPGADQVPPKDMLVFSQQKIEALRKGDLAEIEQDSDPRIKSAGLLETLRQMRDLFPKEEPEKINLFAFIENKETSQVSFAFEYAYRLESVLARITVARNGPQMIIQGFHADPIGMRAAELFGFNWSSKGFLHHAFILVAVFIPLFILVVLYECIRSPIPKRKWLWIVFILFGFVQLTLVWPTGDIRFNPFFFQLLGAGYFAPMQYPPAIGPLLISFSLPIGAIVFLFRRKKIIASMSETGAQ